MEVFPTEYSTLSSAGLLKCINDLYAAKINSLLFIKRGFNDTYLAEGNSSRFIVRIYKHNWRNYESIAAEIDFLNYLKSNGVLVSTAIPDLQGNYIQTLQAVEGTRYLVAFEFAEGTRIRKLTAGQTEKLGAETGKMHRLSQNLFFDKPAQDYTVEHLFTQSLFTLKPILVNYPEHYDSLEELKEKFISLFSKVATNSLPQGICHGDLHAENLHVKDDSQYTFFDFDFFGKGYLVYDIGVFSWYDHKNKPPQIMDAFIKGYQTERPLTDLEIALIPYFGTLRAVFQMAMYCRISDGKQLPLWPVEQIVQFVDKVHRWHYQNAKAIKI